MVERRVYRYAACMPLSAGDIRAAFDALGEELKSEQQNAEMVIAGGAALVLLYGARETTKDVMPISLRRTRQSSGMRPHASQRNWRYLPTG